jgi:hypothetical protein
VILVFKNIILALVYKDNRLFEKGFVGCWFVAARDNYVTDPIRHCISLFALKKQDSTLYLVFGQLK